MRTRKIDDNRFEITPLRTVEGPSGPVQIYDDSNKIIYGLKKAQNELNNLLVLKEVFTDRNKRQARINELDAQINSLNEIISIIQQDNDSGERGEVVGDILSK